MSTIVMRHYPDLPNGDTDERDGMVTVEVGDGEVDLILFPRTPAAMTYSFTAEEAWRLAREIARGAAVLDLEDE